MYGPADATATQSLASVKSRLVFLPFWYRLTLVVPEKGPLNECVCVCVCVYCRMKCHTWGVITGLDPVLPTANASTEWITACYEAPRNSSHLVSVRLAIMECISTMLVWQARLSYLNAECKPTIYAHSADNQSPESVGCKNGIRWTAISDGRSMQVFL